MSEGGRMQRREFITLVGGAAALAPFAVRAQQPERVRVIGMLMNAEPTDPELQRRVSGLREGLKALGWIEGKNLRIEARWGVGDADRVQTYARELAQLAPEVIFTNGTPSTAAVKRETSSIPVVFAIVADPVGDGFVASLSRPAGNITGFSSFDSDIGGKWAELLKEIAPGVTRAALLFNPRTVPGGGTGLMRPVFDAAARKLGMTPQAMPVGSAADIERSLTDYAGAAAGLVVMPDGFLLVNTELVIRLANELRLPTVYPFRQFVGRGGLISYGVDSVDLNWRAATYVDRVLKGANPADLPIQTPTKFELAINLKTAKALGLTIPLPLQAAADEVIE